MMEGNAIVLFDGVCVLCSRLVYFIVKRDHKRRIVFAALQSAAGQRLLKKYHLPPEKTDTVICITGDRVYTRSSAVLYVLRQLDGWWPLLYAFVIVPKPVRDSVYRWIANRRYRWFGKNETCLLPTAEIRERFLGE